ncbi:MAG: class I SAM-dependent methyltransferase [Acidimicrobiia bacterium]|nr:class I SAM-dependent methyltransferase [Acidimicrobiia bacterium]
MGSAYLRYSFTKGTENEVDFLVDQLGLTPGDRVLDVGCGPGRHAHSLGRRGIEVVGVDISECFVEIARRDAPPGVRFERHDARALPYAQEFDAVISLCQGAFGLTAGPAASGATSIDPDLPVLEGMARALRPGGRVAFSAFSAYFQVRYLEDHDGFDAAAGVNHERTVVRSEQGVDAEVSLWTSCFTPRELRLLVAAAGMRVGDMFGVTPGDYAARPPDLDRPELLVIAEG